MKRRLIVEVRGVMPFTDEFSAIYDALSPEEQQRRLADMAAVAKQHFEDEGAEVVAKVYVEEDAN
jgi:hypothetical protein